MKLGFCVACGSTGGQACQSVQRAVAGVRVPRTKALARGGSGHRDRPGPLP
jgi:hypothetical protein